MLTSRLSLFRAGVLHFFVTHFLTERTRAIGFRQRPRRKDLRERLRSTPVRQEAGDIDEDIARMRSRAAKHREYVDQLLDLLSQKRLERMRELAKTVAPTAANFRRRYSR